MALRIVEKIFALFHKASKDTKKTASASARPNLTLRCSRISEAGDLPPPYTVGEDGKLFGNEKSRSPQGSERYVQICPHEALSFDRLQRIANLPNLKTNGKKIDALTPTSDHHHRGHDKDTKEPQDSCKPLGYNISSFIGSLKGFGTYTWKSSGSKSGMMLSFHWEMRCLESAEVKCDSPAELQAFLDSTHIWLCSHKKLSDLAIVNGIYGIINPLGKPVDPIDRYMTKEVGNDCEHCGTKIKVYKRKEGADRTCRVDTKRYLGKAEQAEDQVWLGQCSPL